MNSDFTHLFAYINLAMGILSAVSMIGSMLASPDPIDPQALASVAQSIAYSISLLTHKPVDQKLVTDICVALADVLNKYKSPAASVASNNGTLYPIIP